MSNQASKPYKITIRVPKEVRGWGENKHELPALDAKLEMTVNWDRLYEHFGGKAARSKSGRTSMLGGLIKIKAVSVTEIAA